MKLHQRSGRGLTCLVILIAFAIIAIAGCVDSTHNQQSQVTSTGTQQSENPVVNATVTITMTPAPASQNISTLTPAPQKTSTPTPATGSSDGTIHLNPIGVIHNGEKYVITGTTSLPVGTDMVLQLRPDTGTTPTGYDAESIGGCSGGPAWITEGNGTSNRIVIEGSITMGHITMGQETPGEKWVAVVGDRKDPDWIKNGDYFEMGRHIGYAYFILE